MLDVETRPSGGLSEAIPFFEVGTLLLPETYSSTHPCLQFLTLCPKSFAMVYLISTAITIAGPSWAPRFPQPMVAHNGKH